MKLVSAPILLILLVVLYSASCFNIVTLDGLGSGSVTLYDPSFPNEKVVASIDIDAGESAYSDNLVLYYHIKANGILQVASGPDSESCSNNFYYSSDRDSEKQAYNLLQSRTTICFALVHPEDVTDYRVDYNFAVGKYIVDLTETHVDVEVSNTRPEFLTIPVCSTEEDVTVELVLQNGQCLADYEIKIANSLGTNTYLSDSFENLSCNSEGIYGINRFVIPSQEFDSFNFLVAEISSTNSTPATFEVGFVQLNDNIEKITYDPQSFTSITLPDHPACQKVFLLDRTSLPEPSVDVSIMPLGTSNVYARVAMFDNDAGTDIDVNVSIFMNNRYDSISRALDGTKDYYFSVFPGDLYSENEVRTRIKNVSISLGIMPEVKGRMSDANMPRSVSVSDDYNTFIINRQIMSTLPHLYEPALIIVRIPGPSSINEEDLDIALIGDTFELVEKYYNNKEFQFILRVTTWRPGIDYTELFYDAPFMIKNNTNNPYLYVLMSVYAGNSVQNDTKIEPGSPFVVTSSIAGGNADYYLTYLDLSNISQHKYFVFKCQVDHNYKNRKYVISVSNDISMSRKVSGTTLSTQDLALSVVDVKFDRPVYVQIWTDSYDNSVCFVEITDDVDSTYDVLHQNYYSSTTNAGMVVVTVVVIIMILVVLTHRLLHPSSKKVQ